MTGKIMLSSQDKHKIAFLCITFFFSLFLYTLQYISGQPVCVFARGEDNAHAVDASMHFPCKYVDVLKQYWLLLVESCFVLHSLYMGHMGLLLHKYFNISGPSCFYYSFLGVTRVSVGNLVS